MDMPTFQAKMLHGLEPGEPHVQGGSCAPKCESLMLHALLEDLLAAGWGPIWCCAKVPTGAVAEEIGG
eukprot:9307448-Lingulodinium_polyedra.AAC.1